MNLHILESRVDGSHVWITVSTKVTHHGQPGTVRVLHVPLAARDAEAAALQLQEEAAKAVAQLPHEIRQA